MRVELLYFDGCPNWKVADDRLAEALTELGRDDVVVERRLVDTPELAEELAFMGRRPSGSTGPTRSRPVRSRLASRAASTPHRLSWVGHPAPRSSSML